LVVAIERDFVDVGEIKDVRLAVIGQTIIQLDHAAALEFIFLPLGVGLGRYNQGKTGN
jgi:hypothetical protein